MKTWLDQLKKMNPGRNPDELSFSDFELIADSYEFTAIENDELEGRLLAKEYSESCRNYIGKLVQHFSDKADEVGKSSDQWYESYKNKCNQIIIKFIEDCSGRDRNHCRNYFRSLMNQKVKSKTELKKGGRPTKVTLDTKAIKFIKTGK